MEIRWPAHLSVRGVKGLQMAQNGSGRWQVKGAPRTLAYISTSITQRNRQLPKKWMQQQQERKRLKEQPMGHP